MASLPDGGLAERALNRASPLDREHKRLAVETHENWLEAHRCLNMNDLKQHKKTQLRQAA